MRPGNGRSRSRSFAGSSRGWFPRRFSENVVFDDEDRHRMRGRGIELRTSADRAEETVPIPRRDDACLRPHGAQLPAPRQPRQAPHAIDPCSTPLCPRVPRSRRSLRISIRRGQRLRSPLCPRTCTVRSRTATKVSASRDRPISAVPASVLQQQHACPQGPTSASGAQAGRGPGRHHRARHYRPMEPRAALNWTDSR